MRPLKDRFYEKIEKQNNGCWYWKGGQDKRGYGNIWLNGKPEGVHRASYLIHKGEVPKGLCVCHSCDTPKCVNPDHLFLGTSKENRADMFKKGRQNIPFGDNHAYAKLTAWDIPIIRDTYKAGFLMREIGGYFGVNKNTVRDVIRGFTWAHV